MNFEQFAEKYGIVIEEYTQVEPNSTSRQMWLRGWKSWKIRLRNTGTTKRQLTLVVVSGPTFICPGIGQVLYILQGDAHMDRDGDGDFSPAVAKQVAKQTQQLKAMLGEELFNIFLNEVEE